MPSFPASGSLVCLNPRLRQERARKREQLLRATETILTEIAAAARRHKSNSANRDRTMKRLGREVATAAKSKSTSTFTVTNSDLLWSRNQQRIHNEAQLDGIYVIRTRCRLMPSTHHDAVPCSLQISVHSRARLSYHQVTTRLEVQPIYVYRLPKRMYADMVPVHARSCYLEWHLRQRLKPFLFAARTTHNRQAAPRRFSRPRSHRRQHKKPAPKRLPAASGSQHDYAAGLPTSPPCVSMK